jgi:DNA-binding NarL/FixJ family response regulator
MAWRSELTAGQQHEVLGITNAARSARAMLLQHRPKLVIADLRLLDGTSMAMIQWLASEPDATRPTIVVVSADANDPLIAQAMIAGADNLYLVGQGTLLDCVTRTLRGESTLTPALAQGLLDHFDRSLRSMSTWAALDATESPLQLEPQERALLLRVATGNSLAQLSEQRNVHPHVLGMQARHILRKVHWDQRAGALTLQLA